LKILKEKKAKLRNFLLFISQSKNKSKAIEFIKNCIFKALAALELFYINYTPGDQKYLKNIKNLFWRFD